MSPALYDDIQAFLAERWGPLGGWCQAVVFAADLKPTTPKASRSATPKKVPSATPTPVKKRRSPSAEEKPSLSAPPPLENTTKSGVKASRGKFPKLELPDEPKLELLGQPERKRPRRRVAAVSYKVK